MMNKRITISDALNKKFEALQGEADFWKKQFLMLVNILCEGKELRDTTMDHIKEILK